MLGTQADVDADWSFESDDDAEELYVETELDQLNQPKGSSASAPINLINPLTFQATDPAQRGGARLWLGPPDYQTLRLFYEHSLGPKASAGGLMGVEGGAGRIGGFGRYALILDRFSKSFLTVGGEAWLSLGDRAGLFLQPEIAGGGEVFEGFALTGKGIVRLDLGGNNPGWGPGFMDDIEYGLMGEGAYEVVEGGFIHLGAALRFEPTDIPDGATSQVVTSMTLGGRYRFNEALGLGLGATLPVYERFRNDLNWAIALSADYQF